MLVASGTFTPIAYQAVRDELLVGDILLSRPSSLLGRAITRVTGSPFSHATMVGHAGHPPNHVLMLGETREHQDARLIALSVEIRTWPGYYDVYRLTDDIWDQAAAWAFMCRAAGSAYSWKHVFRVYLRRRIGQIIPPLANSDEPAWPRDCSALIHAAIRAGGGPSLRPHDCDVVPGDLADPKHARYLCTLFSTEEQAQGAAENAQLRAGEMT